MREFGSAFGTAMTRVQTTPDELDASVGAVFANLRELALDDGYPRFTALSAGAHLVDLGGAATAVLTIAPAARSREHPADSHLVGLTITDRGRLSDRQVDDVYACVEALPFTAHEIRRLAPQLPLTRGLAADVDGRPLRGLALFVVAHLVTDLVVQLETLVELGADPRRITVVKKEYAYRHRRRVESHLRARGVAVFDTAHVADALVDHCRRAAGGCLALDDGGYVLPTLLREHPELVPRFRGVVEQTMSGIFRLEPFDDLPLPVFPVAQSEVKRTIEPRWVADRAVRTIVDLLAEEKLEGQPALVVGYGRIGEQIADVLRDRRMRVAVHDDDALRLLAAHERGYATSGDLPSLLRAHRPRLVVGGTGRTSLGSVHFGLLPPGCQLASVSSRDTEFDLTALRELALRVEPVADIGTRYHLPRGPVTVLADGYPVNFHRSDSMSNRCSDLTVAAVTCGACVLARPDHGLADGVDLDRANAALAAAGLVERYYELYRARVDDPLPDQARWDTGFGRTA
ncbi:hypothetical protein GCM10025787_45180 [Saccharopolyspora rosea]